MAEPSLQHSTKEPMAITSPGPSGSRSYLIVSPQVLKPLPKAPPRKSQQADRKRCKSAILTDPPEETYLEDKKKEQEAKKKKVSKRVLTENKENKKVSKGKKMKETAVDNDEDEEEDEEFSFVCLSPYSASKSREVWIQCQDCKFWAHEACTPGLPYYICQNCDSEYSD